MKKTMLSLMLACALLGAGCSDSDETTAAAPTPVPELTAEQLAVIQAEDKAALKRKLEANGMTPAPDAAVAPAQAADVPLTAEASSPTPTPTP
jgi:nitrous oxide reductase accessory protein NosL